MPDADSPVLTAASFNDALLSSGFETVEYIGAFGTDDNCTLQIYTPHFYVI